MIEITFFSFKQPKESRTLESPMTFLNFENSYTHRTPRKDSHLPHSSRMQSPTSRAIDLHHKQDKKTHLVGCTTWTAAKHTSAQLACTISNQCTLLAPPRRQMLHVETACAAHPQSTCTAHSPLLQSINNPLHLDKQR